MSTTSTGSTQSLSTSTVTASTLPEVRASFTSARVEGEVSSIDLQSGDSYDAYFYYKESSASTYNEFLIEENVTSAKVFTDDITGLTKNTDYDYYFSVNQGDSLSSSPETASTSFETSDTNSGSSTLSELPVTTVGNRDQTRTSMVLQGRVEDTASLDAADVFSPFFRYRPEGAANFTDVNLSEASESGLFETELTGLTEDQGYEFVFGANGVEGLIVLRRTPTDASSLDGSEEVFDTLAYQEIIYPADGREQTRRDITVEYDLNIDVQGTHEFIYDRNGTDEVLNTVTTPESQTQQVTIEDIDRDGDVKQYTLTFTDESGGSGPGDLSRTQEITVSVIPVKKFTGDNQTFTVN